MATANTIVLKGKGHHEEGVADATVYPGEAVRLAADGKWDPETLAATHAAQRGLRIVKEDALQGKTVDDAYSASDQLFIYQLLAGDHVQVLVKAGEDIDIGDYLAVEGSGSGKFVEVGVGGTGEHPIPLFEFRTHDAMAVNLPGSATADDMALITGTPGTDAPTLQGVDFGGATSDEKAAVEFVVPDDYRAGGTLTIRCNAGMLTTVADTSCTLDVEVHKIAADGSVGSDICATAAQDINSLTKADIDFTITPTGLAAGDKLYIRLSFAGTDSGNAGVMIPEIGAVSMVYASAVTGQLEAIEDSGGALAAATLITCRVM